MNYLLDTHILIWSLFNPEKLVPSVRDTIVSQENDISVSIVSFWEISLKFAMGKLELHGIMPDELPEYSEQMDIEIIPVLSSEASSFYKLPRLKHKDPFDRMIIWQAIQRKIVLISKDHDIIDCQKFGLKILRF
jgi:PIN domain nuclease of toxin-antitoxin system